MENPDWPALRRGVQCQIRPREIFDAYTRCMMCAASITEAGFLCISILFHDYAPRGNRTAVLSQEGMRYTDMDHTA